MYSSSEIEKQSVQIYWARKNLYNAPPKPVQASENRCKHKVISLLLSIRNRKEKGGGRIRSSQEQLPYYFKQKIERKKEAGGSNAPGRRSPYVLKGPYEKQ